MTRRAAEAMATVVEASLVLARRNLALWAGVFLLGLLAGLAVVTRAGGLAREDVLPAVLALGLSLPLGWLAFGRRRR